MTELLERFKMWVWTIPLRMILVLIDTKSRRGFLQTEMVDKVMMIFINSETKNFFVNKNYIK
jgi:hypothetical protein